MAPESHSARSTMWPFSRRSDATSLAVFIGTGSEIDGRCRFAGTTIIDGHVAGDLLTADHLVIGESGTVASVVKATVVIVKGTVTGNVAATQRVELSATGRVTGDIETPALTMEAGATLEGRCRIAPDTQSSGVVIPMAR